MNSERNRIYEMARDAENKESLQKMMDSNEIYHFLQFIEFTGFRKGFIAGMLVTILVIIIGKII